MCRLFGLTAGTARVKATFWLLDAPDSLQVQSHRNADGAGIGFFDSAGEPVLDKQPEPAFSDQDFVREARQAESSAFVAHVRWATAGGRTVQNTHPFAMDGRGMAHNGGFGELSQLDKELGSYASLVLGDTDSERYFALITKETDAHGGDVGAGITAAASWIAERLPVSALNTIVAVPGELWALRYPGQHALHVLERPAGPGPGKPGLHVRSATSSVHAPALEDTGPENIEPLSMMAHLVPGVRRLVRPRVKTIHERDESLQARSLLCQLELLDSAGVDGAFIHTFTAPCSRTRTTPGTTWTPTASAWSRPTRRAGAARPTPT